MEININPLPNSLSDPIGRREFLRLTGVSLMSLTVAGTLSELLASCSNPTSPVITHGTTTIDVTSLTTDGSFLVSNNAKPDGTPILVVRQTSASYLALSMLCTHEQCQVNNPSGGSIYCSCHGSRFNMQGNVIQGPANSPLARYTTTYDATTKSLKVDY